MDYLNERIDYVKWAELHTPASVTNTMAILDSCAREQLEKTGEALDYGYVYTGREAAGFGVYLFEVRGSGADTFVREYAPLVNWHNLRRIDYRVEVECDDETFRNWRASRSANPDKSRNYNAFNTRVRAKTDDRDRGGYGLAIGSLKSDNRVSFYQEAPGVLALEKQVRGKTASRIGLDVLALCDVEEVPLKDGYEIVMRILQHHTDDFTLKLFDNSLRELAVYFASDTSHERLPPLPTADQAAEILLQHCKGDGIKAIQLLLNLLV